MVTEPGSSNSMPKQLMKANEVNTGNVSTSQIWKTMVGNRIIPYHNPNMFANVRIGIVRNILSNAVRDQVKLDTR